jgi:hypothetical protein
MGARRRAIALGACALAAALASAAGAEGGGTDSPAARAAWAAPAVEQLVVFRSGRARAGRVSTRGATVRVGRRRCALATGTALAALVRSRPGRIRLRDYGSCSRRARDAVSLFVVSIAGDRNRGRDGWVYKVGRRTASAGAADPSGAFGRGRLRRGQRVTWFYCRMSGPSCQRTLSVRARVEPGRVVALTVTGYDDEGRGVPVAGATVRGLGTHLTGADGVVRVPVAPGSYRVSAVKAGLVRSFGERVAVR